MQFNNYGSVHNVSSQLTIFASSFIFLQDTPLAGIQMLWVNLLMDSLAALALATERPTNNLLDRKPYGFSEPIVSPLMLVNILSHATYELVVLFVLLYAG